MNALLDKAIFAIRKLPEAEQEAIARHNRTWGISTSRRISATS